MPVPSNRVSMVPRTYGTVNVTVVIALLKYLHLRRLQVLMFHALQAIGFDVASIAVVGDLHGQIGSSPASGNPNSLRHAVL